MHLPVDTGPVVKKRVVLVHHNALLREGLCRILEADDFKVVWQNNDGAGVIDNAVRYSPEVILLEWEAPGVDASLIEQLVTFPDKAPVVIMTRPDTVDDLTPVLDAGAVGCLSVNLSADDFLSALRLLAHGDLLISHEMVAAITSTEEETEQPEDRLTPRELDILRALGRGATNQEIADELYISPHTVKIHVRRVLAKMNFRNRQQAAAYAAANNLL